MRILSRWLLILFLLTAPLSAEADEASAIPLVDELRRRAIPLKMEADLTPLIQRARPATLVLLGDASHGTYDFYRVRSHITQRLIEEQPLAFVAIEGDWEGAAAVDRYVRDLPGAAEDAATALNAFAAWPDWVWNNGEMAGLVEFLRRSNAGRPESERVAFYGIDLLAFNSSLERLATQESTADAARQLRSCLSPYQDEPLDYPRALLGTATDCASAVAALGAALTTVADTLPFAADQRLRIVSNAEAYYRAMARSSTDAWNLRVAHFADTLERLLEHHGPAARGIVWAHNTHIGDARATEVAGRGMHSLGQLLRERLGEEQLLLVGSATHRGSVLAARQWGALVESLTVPPAIEASCDALLRQAGQSVAYWLFSAADRPPAPLGSPCGQRAVGVVYQPEFDARDNYLATVVPWRYDALIFIETTTALELPPAPTE